MESLFKILTISLFCNGVYLLFHFGNMLEPLRLIWIEMAAGIPRNDGEIAWARNSNRRVIHPIKVFLYKPLFGCITCMASIWGTIAYWALSPINIASLIIWPIIIVSCACVNFLINRLYE